MPMGYGEFPLRHNREFLPLTGKIFGVTGVTVIEDRHRILDKRALFLICSRPIHQGFPVASESKLTSFGDPGDLVLPAAAVH